MAETEPDQVDIVSLDLVLQFAQMLPEASKRYISQKFGHLLSAKEEWRKQRVESECVSFSNQMFELFATGSAHAIPLEEFADNVRKLEGLSGQHLSEGHVLDLKVLHMFWALWMRANG